mmetsp:Transcript_22776/g.52487  ORF Transcript_22776/g.52487 Transcript_22776/m.52487 type:complete len:334 (-) Transcript_22776:369-1370(-)
MLSLAAVALGLSAPRARSFTPATIAPGNVGVSARPSACYGGASAGVRRAVLRMQEGDTAGGEEGGEAAVALLSKEASIYDEFLASDPNTGERVRINLAEKEKLYLDCLDAFYNEGKVLLGDEEYEQLKLDLDFEGSQIATFDNKEIKFLIANKRFRMGTPVLDDKEYDKLRRELKEKGSVVVLHDAPTCRADTGVCKLDMRVDNGKQRLLYFPGTVAGLVLVCELCFWTLHTDPLLSILLGALPSYFFGVWFTENIFAQKPLVVQTACPECNYLLTAFFGDLFNVQKDGITGPPTPPQSQIQMLCPECKSQLTLDRETMVIATQPKFAATASS